jgi:hypothetical protein
MRITSSDVQRETRAEMATFPRTVYERDAILHVDVNRVLFCVVLRAGREGGVPCND